MFHVDDVMTITQTEAIVFWAGFGLGLIAEAVRRRAMQRMAWRIFHASVHMPWRRNR